MLSVEGKNVTGENTLEKETPLVKRWTTYLGGSFLPESVVDEKEIEELQKNEYRNLISEIMALNPEEQKKVFQHVSSLTISQSQDNPENFQDIDINQYTRYHNFVRAFGYWGNGVDFIRFAVQMRKLFHEKKLKSGYRYEGYVAPIFLIEKQAADLEKTFSSNNVDEARMILDFLVDAFYHVARLTDIPTEKLEEYCQKTQSILANIKEKTDNYFIQLKTEQTIFEFQYALKYGLEGIRKQVIAWISKIETNEIERARVNIGLDYDRGYQDIIQEAIKEKNKNESQEGILKNSNDFSIFYNRKLREAIKNDLGLDFEIMPEAEKARAQLYTLSFLKRAKTTELEKYKKYFEGPDADNNSSRINRIKAFFSLEIDGQNGDKIIEISQKLQPEYADKVFKKIAEIIDKTGENLSELMNRRSSDIDLDKLRLELLRKAHQIILDFSGSEKDVQALLKDLDSSKTEIILLSELMKVAKEKGIKLVPENIRDMKPIGFSRGELSGEKKNAFRERYAAQIMDMMRQSYKKVFSDNPAAREKVEKAYQKRFENLENYRVYLLTFREEVIAFSVIDPSSKDCQEGEVMSESTIVHGDVQKYSLGIAFLKTIFEQELTREGVKAICGKVRANHPAMESYAKIGLVKDKTRPEIFLEEGEEYNWVRKTR